MLYLVSEHEELIYHLDSQKDSADSVAVTDKRLYHHSKSKNAHTCLSIKNIIMVKFISKRIKREPSIFQTIFKFIILIATAISAIALTFPELLGFGNNEILVSVSITIVLAALFLSTRYVNESVMEIEYSSGSKVDILMKLHNEATMYDIRNAIYTAIDYNESL